MEKVLVTGAGGFVGGYIARYLLEGGYDVTGIIRRRNGQYPFPVIAADLAQSIAMDEKFDIIVHAAGSLPYKETDFTRFKQNNIDSMVNLLDFAHRTRVSRMIYLSTIGIYGEFRDAVVTENADRINPDAYGITKYVAECLLRAADGIAGISLRMPGIIGKGSRGVWLTNIVEKIWRNEDVKIYSPDFQTKNFVWVDDLAKFVDKLIGMDLWRYDVVNLACSPSASIREIIMEIKNLTNSLSRVVVDNSIRQPFCLDSSKAVEMGYESTTPIEIVRSFIMGSDFGY